MNYLAHLLLSGSDPKIRVGNFLGDWFRGKQHHNLPVKIQQGIELHRAIDQFADQHHSTKASYLLLRPELGRYAHPIVDVLQDHFLTVHFDTFSDSPLDDFTLKAISDIKSEAHHLPSPFPEKIATMFTVNWLAKYGTDEGMNRSFLNLSKRATNANKIAQSWIIAQAFLPELNKYFLDFFPDILEFAKSKRLNDLKLHD